MKRFFCGAHVKLLYVRVAFNRHCSKSVLEEMKKKTHYLRLFYRVAFNERKILRKSIFGLNIARANFCRFCLLHFFVFIQLLLTTDTKVPST